MSAVLALSSLTPLASAITAHAVPAPLSADVTCVNEKAVLTVTARQANLPGLPVNAENWKPNLAGILPNIHYTTNFGSASQTLTAGDEDVKVYNTNSTAIDAGTAKARVTGWYTTKETQYLFGFPLYTYDQSHYYDNNTLSAAYDAKNCDATAPTASVSYSTTTLTNGNVVATIVTNEPVQNISGWTLSVDKKKLQKTYTANTNEVVAVKDLAGNTTPTSVVITWIDTSAPVVTNITQAYEVHNGVQGRYAVTVTLNESVTVEQGWNEVAGSNKTKFKKIYYTAEQVTANFTDLAGNVLAYIFTINPVVNNAPVVSFVNPTPAENSYVRGTISAHVTASDDYGMGSYYVRVWKGAFESGIANLVKNDCYSAPGAFLLGTSQDITCNYDTTTNSDGKYVLSAQFLDGNNAWGSQLRTIYVDNTAPTYTVKPESIGTGNVFSNVSFKLQDNGSKIDKVTINGVVKDLTNNTYSDVNGVKPGVFGAVEGSNTLVVYDVAGNTKTYTFTLDTIAPSVPVHVSPFNNAIQNVSDFWFEWNDVEGAVSYEAQFSQSDSTDPITGSLNSGVWAGDSNHIQPTVSKAWSTGANGTWFWQVRAIDAAGNKGTWSTPWKLTIDKVVPDTPTLTSPEDGVVTKGASITQSWNSTSTDVHHYVYQSYNDEAATSVRWTENFTGTSKTATNVSDSVYWWRVKAVDHAGNESAWSPLWKITVDNTPPTVSLDAVDTNSNTSRTITGTGEEGAEVTVTVHSVEQSDTVTVGSDGKWSVTFSNLEVGPHTVKAVSKDKAGNVTSELMQEFAVTAPVVAQSGDDDDDDDTPSTNQRVALNNNTDTEDVLGTETEKSNASDNAAANSSDDSDVKGATDSNNAGNIFGLAWYWWLLLLAAIAAAWWFIAAWRRRQNEEA